MFKLIIELAIFVVLAINVFRFVTYHNVQMLQLNEYKFGSYLKWVGKNISKQWLLFLGIIIGVINIIFPNIWCFCLILITEILMIASYYAKQKVYNKTPLIYTARTKRILLINSLITLISTTILICALPTEVGLGFSLIVLSCEPIILLITVILLSPIEILINSYYIHDAKRILAKHPNLIIIGITGSYGKTSMKFCLEKLLQEKYNVLVTPKNYNTPLGIVKTIRNKLNDSHQIFLCEMGARYKGDIKEICNIVKPTYGIITSVGPQHLETFHNINTITKTKFELADSLPKEGQLFLNYDNDIINNYSNSYTNKIFYSTECKDCSYSEIEFADMNGTKFTMTIKNESCTYYTKLIGKHNISNITGAATVANYFGILLDDLIIPIRQLEPVKHRLEIRKENGIIIIDDAYNSNPISSKIALETLEYFKGTKILITPGMVELGKESKKYNHNFGIYASKHCDYIYLVKSPFTKDIQEGLEEANFNKKKIKEFSNVKDAISEAYNFNANNKIVLIENDLPDNF